MPFKFSENSKKNRRGVDDRLIAISDLALQYSTIDFGIPETGGLRSAAMQHALYLEGKSDFDGTIKRSKHQTGKALDVFAFVDGKPSWEPEHLQVIAWAFFRAAQALGHHIRWGGFWRSRVDMPHFEIVK